MNISYKIGDIVDALNCHNISHIGDISRKGTIISDEIHEGKSQIKYFYNYQLAKCNVCGNIYEHEYNSEYYGD